MKILLILEILFESTGYTALNLRQLRGPLVYRLFRQEHRRVAKSG